MFKKFDAACVDCMHKMTFPLARFALFLIYFWFGLLKVVGESPASPLVSDLLEKTLPFITFDQFIVLFGFFEMLIGILFLIPRLERVAIVLFAIHMVTTFMPLILLPAISWSGMLVPTLEGQYIIKNIALIALAALIGGRLKKTENN